MPTSAELLVRFTSGFCAALLETDTYDMTTGERDDIGAYLWHTPSTRWALVAFGAESREILEGDCQTFVLANLRDIRAYALARWGSPTDESAWEDAGQDFLLTRNRHGAGFWDRGLGTLGDRLTNAAHAYGAISAYVDMRDDAPDSRAHLD